MMNPQVNMAGMGGPQAGGPVGGAPMMNNKSAPRGQNDYTSKLNTYIYDYLLKHEKYDLARAFKDQMPIVVTNASPGGKGMNGVDDMDTDSKDGVKRPDDLPLPNVPSYSQDCCFLLDWWCQFWDIFAANRGGQPGMSQVMSQYLKYTMNQTQMRNDATNKLLRQPDVAPNGMMNRGMMMGMPGRQGIPMTDMQRQALARGANPQQLQQMKNMQGQPMMPQNMRRDGSGIDMNQPRPQSPNVGDNAPSPKRARIDGSNFNGQPMGPGGRPQGMPGQVNMTTGPNGQMLLQSGLPADMNAQQMQQFANANGMQPKLEGMTPGMMPQMGDGTVMGDASQMQAGAGQGNHALHDYQMQLMLLEQQNKRRLLMARQEQEAGTQNFVGAPSMSPSGSRTGGPSPNSNDQMKRGTPKLHQPGLPGSPMPDGMAANRGSPAPNFDPSQMPQGMQPQFYQQMGGPMMRPPSSMPTQFNPQQLEALRASGRMPNVPNGWQGGNPQGMMRPGGPQPQGPPQGQGGPPGQPPQATGPQAAQMGTPQQRASNMGPPPAPASGEPPQRTQPPSPSQSSTAAPPTPSQSTKPNPKAKKEKREPQKKTGKKAGAAATPATEAEPPTPTPSTPITPMHPGGGFKNGAPPPNANANANANAAPNASAGGAPASQPAVQQPVPPQMDNGPTFDLSGGAPEFSLDLMPDLANNDVLENFDFESFLQTDGDTGMQFDTLAFSDGVEAGMGDM